jgi:hypothetical protein
MNRDEFEVGDLVIKDSYIQMASLPVEHYGIGIAVITYATPPSLVPATSARITGKPLKIYWFKLGEARVEWSISLTKLCPTQDKTK